MSAVRRLVVLVELAGDGADRREASFGARLDAELADGGRVVVLDDRGWTSSLRVAGGDGSENLDVWASYTRAQVEETARVVVGPDEPPDGRSHDEEADLHWAHLAAVLAQRGAAVSPGALRSLPLDVELGERLRERLDG